MRNYDTVMYKLRFHIFGVPELEKGRVKSTYMKQYNIAEKIFNDNIGWINEEWDKTGKKASFGEFLEDVNPEYVEFIAERINKLMESACQKSDPYLICKIGEYGAIEGYLPSVKDSRVYVDFIPAKI